MDTSQSMELYFMSKQDKKKPSEHHIFYFPGSTTHTPFFKGSLSSYLRHATPTTQQQPPLPPPSPQPPPPPPLPPPTTTLMISYPEMESASKNGKVVTNC